MIVQLIHYIMLTQQLLIILLVFFAMKHYQIVFNVSTQFNVLNALQILFYKEIVAKIVAMTVKKYN